MVKAQPVRGMRFLSFFVEKNDFEWYAIEEYEFYNGVQKHR